MTPGCRVVLRVADRRLLLRMLVIGVMLLSSCAPGADLPPTPDPRIASYQLGPGDLLRITTFGEPDLTAEMRVSDSGNIAMPLLGSIPANGLSVDELAAKINRGLRANNILRDAKVTVEVVTYRPVYILGEVAKPGRYPYEPGMTVLTAVSVAGGFTYRAIQDYASVLRVDGGKGSESRAQRQTVIQPGDVITIYERVF